MTPPDTVLISRGIAMKRIVVNCTALAKARTGFEKNRIAMKLQRTGRTKQDTAVESKRAEA